ncbi:clathrin interactor EPSIN 2-like [Impatiens glandulifera]|uniref:clathrin interactor EPSIN 2-like n=1 Tax=Impatiens glandulifera TaxID=253017 RepID=UPI001FB08A79|nr:clathrin interactor EPSIN 2-like [Impatiens glandulifera]
MASSTASELCCLNNSATSELCCLSNPTTIELCSNSSADDNSPVSESSADGNSDVSDNSADNESADDNSADDSSAVDELLTISCLGQIRCAVFLSLTSSSQDSTEKDSQQASQTSPAHLFFNLSLLVILLPAHIVTAIVASQEAFHLLLDLLYASFQKREVNKKVLKVPGIEQKVLDATSNEPWGPHGSLLADIAQASRNYHEYQITMSIIWKRINDTGKNWRHVYKGLTVLEYLVANGSERVIDDIKEHVYQISALSDFQYIDSSGKDQGNNVRKKSQSLVVLVNDKDRIQEARQKAAANREKFRNTSTGNMYRPSTGGYGDRYDEDRYGSRDDDRGGYGGNKDGDGYGRYGESQGRNGDRYGRDSDERYGREDYKDDDNRGRRSFDGQQYSSRSRSSDREKDQSYEGDGQYSSRGNGAKVDDNSQDGRKPDMKYSEQNFNAPPSYEEAVGEVKSPVRSERGGETSAASAPRTFSPPVSEQAAVESVSPALAAASPTFPDPSRDNDDSRFDQFDPRGFAPAPSVSSNGAEIDLLGSLTEAFSSDALAVVPVTAVYAASEADAFSNHGPVPTFAASQSPPTFAASQSPPTFAASQSPPTFAASQPPPTFAASQSPPTFAASQSPPTFTNQGFDDPFGDGPFQAHSSTTTTTSVPTQSQQVISTSSSIPADTYNNNNFETPQNSFSTLPYAATSSVPNVHHPSTESQFLHQEHPISNQDNDILANILPLAGPSFPAPPQMGFPGQGPSGFPVQAQQPTSVNASQGPQSGFNTQNANFYGSHQQPGSTAAQAQYYMGSQPPPPPPVQAQQYSNNPGLLPPQAGVAGPRFQISPQVQSNTPQMSSQVGLSSSTGALVVATPPQPPAAKDKFEPKSAVWADTLSRGLVNLNIYGSKTNPLADIGVDFDAINRKEKRMEKSTATTVAPSLVNMGKAMGSGSGMGRPGSIGVRPPPPSANPMMGPPGMQMGMGMGMQMGMGGRPVQGMAMGNYGGMGMGMNTAGGGMGMGMNTAGGGMGMNTASGGMGMGGYNMMQQQQPTGFPPRSMGGGYNNNNPMMGGGYMPQQQQPYGGGGSYQ